MSMAKRFGIALLVALGLAAAGATAASAMTYDQPQSGCDMTYDCPRDMTYD